MADEYIIRLRRGKLIDWQTTNPIAELGEAMVVFDGSKTYLKIGNGLDNFNTLPYLTDSTSGGTIDLTSYLKKDLSNLSTIDLDRAIRLTNAYKTIESQFPQYYGIRATESETTQPFDFNSTTDNIIHIIYDLNRQSQRLQQNLPTLSFMQGKIVIFEVKYGTGITSGEVVLMPTGADKINGLNNPIEITKQGIGGILLATSTTFDWLPYDVIHDNKIIVTDGVEIVKANNIEFNGQGVTISQKGDNGVVVNITGNGGISTIDYFTELKDTPDSYSGQSGKFLQVNALENSLQFTDVPKDTAEQIVGKIETLKGTNDALSYTALKDLPTIPTSETAEQTRDKLQTLTNDDRLDASAIKNLPSVSLSDMITFKTGFSIQATNLTGNQINGNHFAYVYPLKDGTFAMIQISDRIGYKGELIGYVRNNVQNNAIGTVELIANIQTGVTTVSRGEDAYIGFTSQNVVEVAQESYFNNGSFGVCGIFGDVNDIGEYCVLFDTFKLMAYYYAKESNRPNIALISDTDIIPIDKEMVVIKSTISSLNGIVSQRLPDVTKCNGLMLYAIIDGDEFAKLQLIAYGNQSVGGQAYYEVRGGFRVLFMAINSQWVVVPLSNNYTADVGLTNVAQASFDGKLLTSDEFKNKADIDLQNVDFTRAKRFDNAVNSIAQYHDITSATLKTQLSVHEEQQNIDFGMVKDKFLLLKYQMTSADQELTQILPPLSDDRTIIFEKIDSASVNSTTLIIQADGTDFINGVPIPIRVTENGIAGVMFNAGNTWEWIPYPVLHEDGLVISDDKNNIFMGDKNIKFAKATLSKNGNEVTITPDASNGMIKWQNLDDSSPAHNSNTVMVETPLKVELDPQSSSSNPMSKLYIDHGYYENKHSEGIFAKLSQDVEINVSGDKSEKLWFDEVRIGRNNSFIYPNVNQKAFVVQDVDPKDDPNISGGTLCFIAFDFQPMKGELALGDSYLEIKCVNTNTGDYILDTDGNPIEARINYKVNDEIKPEFICGTYRATGAVNMGFEIGGDIQDIIRVSSNTCILIQSIFSNEVDGLAYLAFCNYTGYRFLNSNKYYGNGLMTFGSTLQQDEPFTIAEPDTGEIDGNGIFIHNASRLQVEISNHKFIIKDNGGLDFPVFCLGKLFDSTDTKYLKGKTINVVTTLKNQENAFVVSLMTWDGEVDKANYRMLTGYANDQPQFSSNWTESDKYQIDEDITLDIHPVTNTFTLPNNKSITQFAIILRPLTSEIPCNLELEGFDANVSPSFNELVFEKNIHISEERLKYEATKYRFNTYKPSWASAFRYTINAGHTPLPWGVIDTNINGNNEKLIVNDGSWHTSSANYPNEGDGQFNKDGHVTMSYSLNAYCGEGTPNGGTVGTQIWLSKVNEDGTFTKLINSETIFIQHKDIKTPVKVQSDVFEFDVKRGDKYRIFSQSDYDDGCYLQTNSVSQSLLALNITFDSLTVEQEQADAMTVLREETFIDYRYTIPPNPTQITTTPVFVPLGKFYVGNADVVVGEHDITALTDCVVNGNITVTINGRSGNSGRTISTLKMVKIDNQGITTDIPNIVNHGTIDYVDKRAWWSKLNFSGIQFNKGEKFGFQMSINTNQQYYFHSDSNGAHPYASETKILFNEINMTEREAINELLDLSGRIIITDAAKAAHWYIELDVDTNGKPSLSPKQRSVSP